MTNSSDVLWVFIIAGSVTSVINSNVPKCLLLDLFNILITLDVHVNDSL